MVQSATASIPTSYRLLLTTIEPLFALLGALQVFFYPALYLSTLSRHTTLFEPGTHFLYTQLSGAWLLFAFNEAIVLRAFDDVRVWRYLVCGMLLSDVAYCHSCAQAVGGWGAWVVVSNWEAADWVVFVTTAPFVVTRGLIALGVGVTADKGKMG